MDRQHGPCVLHDPVLIHVWCIVIAGSAGRKRKDLKSCAASQALEEGGNSSYTGIANKQLNHMFHVVAGISNIKYQQTSRQWLPSFIGSYTTSSTFFNHLLSELSFRLKDHYQIYVNIWDMPKCISQKDLIVKNAYLNDASHKDK